MMSIPIKSFVIDRSCQCRSSTVRKIGNTILDPNVEQNTKARILRNYRLEKGGCNGEGERGCEN